MPILLLLSFLSCTAHLTCLATALRRSLVEERGVLVGWLSAFDLVAFMFFWSERGDLLARESGDLERVQGR